MKTDKRKTPPHSRIKSDELDDKIYVMMQRLEMNIVELQNLVNLSMKYQRDEVMERLTK